MREHEAAGRDGVKVAQAATWTQDHVVDASGADLVIRTYLEQAEVRRYLAHAARKTTLASACDVGAGYGRMSCVLREFCDRVVAVERDPALAAAGSHLLPTVEFRPLGALTSLPAADGEFDFALTFTVLQHLEDDLARDAVTEIRRVVRPGGYVLLCEETVDDRDPPQALPGPDAGYRPRKLERYQDWMRPCYLVAAAPRLAERSYPRVSVGSYLLFQRPAARHTGNGMSFS